MEQRVITFPAAVSLVVASMVGIGVFTSVGFQLAAIPSGFPILMLWILGGIVSLCGAFCYAELVAMMPKSGGEYHLLRESYHPLVGFLAGWVSVIAGFVAPLAALGMALASYLRGLGVAVPPGVIAVTAVVLLALVHLSSLRVVGVFLTWTTALKVGLIVVFLAGVAVAGSAALQPLTPKPGDLATMASPAFATSMVYVMFAYSGWNGAAYIAGEVRDAQRIVPRAFVAGVLLVMALYVAIHAVYVALVPWSALEGHVEAGLIAARHLFGTTRGDWMGALIACGIVSSIAAYTWAGSRVLQRMGQDYGRMGLLGHSNRCGAPYIAIGFQTVLAVAMILTGTFDAVVNYLTLLLQLCSLMVAVAVIHLRRTRPDAPRPFRVPWYPLTPWVFIVVSVWMLAFVAMERPVESGLGLLTLLGGAGLYALVKPR